MASAVTKDTMDYTIKPEAGTSSISTSEWPLLLKNYDKRMLSYRRLVIPPRGQNEDIQYPV